MQPLSQTSATGTALPRHDQRGADSESLSPSPKQIPLSSHRSQSKSHYPCHHPFGKPHSPRPTCEHIPPPDSPSTHPRWGDAPRPRFPGRGVTGGTDTLRSEPAVTPGGGSSTAPPGPPPRGSAVRAACFQLPAKSPLPHQT